MRQITQNMLVPATLIFLMSIAGCSDSAESNSPLFGPVSDMSQPDASPTDGGDAASEPCEAFETCGEVCVDPQSDVVRCSNGSLDADIGGTYLVSMITGLSPQPIFFEFEIRQDGGLLEIDVQPLTSDLLPDSSPRENPRTPVGMERSTSNVQIGPEGDFLIEFEAVAIPAEANPISESALTITFAFEGQIEDRTRFCGIIAEGQISEPIIVPLDESPVGGVLLEGIAASDIEPYTECGQSPAMAGDMGSTDAGADVGPSGDMGQSGDMSADMQVDMGQSGDMGADMQVDMGPRTDACLGPSDQMVVMNQRAFVEQIALICATSSPVTDRLGEVATCISQNLSLSLDCSYCFAAPGICILDGCGAECSNDLESSMCQTCVATNGCEADFAVCSGLTN